jgi:hypothetical protein
VKDVYVRRSCSSCTLSAQCIRDRVEARGFSRQPTGGAESTASEDFAIAGAVREFQPFTWPENVDSVIARNVAAAKRKDANFARSAGTDLSGAFIKGLRVGARVADSVSEPLGGTARCVYFFVVMDFQDFNVEVSTQATHGLLDDFREDLHS